MLAPLLALALAPSLSAQPPRASAWLVPWDPASPGDAALSCLDELNPFSYALDRLGEPVLASARPLAAAPRAPGRLLIPVIVNDVVERRGRVEEKSPEVLASLLNDDRRAERHAHAILAALPLDRVDGVEIDYERVPPGAWPRYARFLGLLGRELHARGKLLQVDVEAGPLFKRDKGRSAFGELARAVDAIKVMAYYQRGAWAADAGPGSSLSWLSEVARRSLAVIPADKLAIALSVSGTDWELPYPRVAALRRVERLHYDKVLELLARREGRLDWSAAEQAPYFDYESRGAKHRLWYEDSRSIAAKVRALRAAGVRRIALWYVGKAHIDLNTSGLCSR